MCVPNIFCLLIYYGITLYNYSVCCFLCAVYCNRKLTFENTHEHAGYIKCTVFTSATSCFMCHFYCLCILPYSFSNMCEIMLTNIYLFTHAHSHCRRRQYTVDSSLCRRQQQDILLYEGHYAGHWSRISERHLLCIEKTSKQSRFHFVIDIRSICFTLIKYC